MGTMDFKTDPSAVTINLLLIVHPEETASKQKGQRERQTEERQSAGKVPPAVGVTEGRAAGAAPAAQETVKQSSSFGAGFGLPPTLFLCRHAAKHPNFKLFFLEIQRAFAGPPGAEEPLLMQCGMLHVTQCLTRACNPGCRRR